MGGSRGGGGGEDGGGDGGEDGGPDRFGGAIGECCCRFTNSILVSCSHIVASKPGCAVSSFRNFFGSSFKLVLDFDLINSSWMTSVCKVSVSYFVTASSVKREIRPATAGAANEVPL